MDVKVDSSLLPDDGSRLLTRMGCSSHGLYNKYLYIYEREDGWRVTQSDLDEPAYFNEHEHKDITPLVLRWYEESD